MGFVSCNGRVSISEKLDAKQFSTLKLAFINRPEVLDFPILASAVKVIFENLRSNSGIIRGRQSRSFILKKNRE